jgi:hypothetical protein
MFRIVARSRSPDLSESAMIFGPLGLPHRLHLVREIRHICLVVDVNDTGAWAMKRLRARLSLFVESVRQDTDDDAKNSLLKKLHIRFAWNGGRPDRYTEQYMFALEALTSLRGIEDVSVKDIRIADIDPCFTQCVELCIKGEGGDVNERDRTVRYVKRRHSSMGRWSRNRYIRDIGRTHC